MGTLQKCYLPIRMLEDTTLTAVGKQTHSKGFISTGYLERGNPLVTLTQKVETGK